MFTELPKVKEPLVEMKNTSRLAKDALKTFYHQLILIPSVGGGWLSIEGEKSVEEARSSSLCMKRGRCLDSGPLKNNQSFALNPCHLQNWGRGGFVLLNYFPFYIMSLLYYFTRGWYYLKVVRRMETVFHHYKVKKNSNWHRVNNQVHIPKPLFISLGHVAFLGYISTFLGICNRRLN